MKTNDSKAIVSTRQIVKDFGEVEALKGVTIDIPQGVVYGLLGPNGAGKTTLIRILATLLKPTSGSAYVAGIDVEADPAAVREKIGLAGQSAAVDKFLTGRETLIVTGRLYNLTALEARRRANVILERIDLSEAADRIVKTYSGGMKRRLDLAACLVGEPQVLFLDEPTTGLDPRSRSEVWKMIKELVEKGATLLLTTQYLDEADQLADRIGVIDNGLLISEGTSDELKKRVGQDVIELQVGKEHQSTAARLLEQLDGYSPALDTATSKLTLSTESGPATLTRIVRLLDEAHIPPLGVSLREPTLDDVFLALTGATTATDTGDPEERAAGSRRRRRRGDAARTGGLRRRGPST
ncbi:MAG: ATP-binding cassette domain-containing protein [bacterium]|nr:ATP-binding cassette domain-containing protein [bacterium]